MPPFPLPPRVSCVASTLPAQPLPGTKPLEMQGDIAKQMVEGIDRDLMREWPPRLKNAGRLEAVLHLRRGVREIDHAESRTAQEDPRRRPYTCDGNAWAIMFTNDPKGLDRVFLMLAKGRPFFLITEAESLRLAADRTPLSKETSQKCR